jgi:hypothetical protein
MGPEALIYPGAVVGGALFVAFLYLIYRSGSRPFALPSFVAALLWAWSGSVTINKPEYFWVYFFLSFLGGGLVFGLHATGIHVMLKLAGIAKGQSSSQAGSHEAASNQEI